MVAMVQADHRHRPHLTVEEAAVQEAFQEASLVEVSQEEPDLQLVHYQYALPELDVLDATWTRSCWTGRSRTQAKAGDFGS